MNLKSMVSTLLIFTILTSSLAVYTDDEQKPTTFIAHSFLLQYGNDSNLLNLTSRASIYEFIQSNPGTHLRSICTNLSISIGSVQYHLEQLTESNLIESEKDSKYKRFFVSRRFKDFEKRVIAFLRKPNACMIIRLCSGSDGCSHQELASLVGVSSQAVTWHVQRLIEENILVSWMYENSTFYRVSDKARETLNNLITDNEFITR